MTLANAALLVMDYQEEIVAMHACADEIVRTAEVLAAVRARKIPVAHVVVGFRPHYPEIAESNQGFSRLRGTGRLVAPRPIDALAPADGEPVVTKRRVGAIYGTDLPVILSAFGARHLILAGISTSGVILSTVRAAADMDFRLTVLADCCADPDPSVHTFLMDRTLPRQCAVTSAQTFLAGLI